MIFLFQGGELRFHVTLPGCIYLISGECWFWGGWGTFSLARSPEPCDLWVGHVGVTKGTPVIGTHDWRIIPVARWWFEIYVFFIPKLGEMIQFDEHIFFRWVAKNHHYRLVSKCLTIMVIVIRPLGRVVATWHQACHRKRGRPWCNVVQKELVSAKKFCLYVLLVGRNCWLPSSMVALSRRTCKIWTLCMTCRKLPSIADGLRLPQCRPSTRSLWKRRRSSTSRHGWQMSSQAWKQRLTQQDCYLPFLSSKNFETLPALAEPWCTLTVFSSLSLACQTAFPIAGFAEYNSVMALCQTKVWQTRPLPNGPFMAYK